MRRLVEDEPLVELRRIDGPATWVRPSAVVALAVYTPAHPPQVELGPLTSITLAGSPSGWLVVRGLPNEVAKLLRLRLVTPHP